MKNIILQRAPDTPDSSKHYLFYLHGLIIEVAGIRPKSEEHGYYEYELILSELARKGFVVISEAREKDTQVQAYAEYLAGQVKKLLVAGVPQTNITIVGASKGGIIAAYTSSILQENEINFVFLAGLFDKCLVDENLTLHGRVLSIHDRSDTLSMNPDAYFQRSKEQGSFEKIVLTVDLGHGVIYQPYREWLDPMMKWLEIT
ncbi:MAG: alpha/beta hydrolase [Desulforhopalus sp.]